MSIILTDENIPSIDEVRAASIAIGKRHFGEITPRIYLCGHCRNIRIEPGDGLCRSCDRMLSCRHSHRNIRVGVRSWITSLAARLRARQRDV